MAKKLKDFTPKAAPAFALKAWNHPTTGETRYYVNGGDSEGYVLPYGVKGYIVADNTSHFADFKIVITGDVANEFHDRRDACERRIYTAILRALGHKVAESVLDEAEHNLAFAEIVSIAK